MTPTDFSPSFEVTGVNTMDWPRYFSPSSAAEDSADATDSARCSVAR